MSTAEPAASSAAGREHAPTVAATGGRRVVRAAVQVVGFAIGLALLWWVVRGVFSPTNRDQLDRLRAAPPASVAALLGLAVATLAINGAAFQAAIHPVRRLRTLDLQAVNAVAALLAMLPFKLSVVFRVLVHHRRDRLPLLTIAAWFGALAATMAAATLPPLGASLWRGRIDAWWIAVTSGGIALLTLALIAGARMFSDGPGWRGLERAMRRLPLPRAIRGTDDGARPGLLPRIHEGLRMLAHPRAVVACIGLRLADAAVHATRFLVAASILGRDLPADKAVIAGTTYFLIGAAAPSGQLGAREAGTAALLGVLMTGVDLDQFAGVVLLVTATEATVLLVCAMAGAAWLRRGGRAASPPRDRAPAS